MLSFQGVRDIGMDRDKYGEAEPVVGSGYMLKTWAGDIARHDCSQRVCDNTDDYHCVEIINDRSQKLTIECVGDDEYDSLQFDKGNGQDEHWNKIYTLYPGTGSTGSIRDRGAKISIKSSNQYSETIITLAADVKWMNGPQFQLDPEASFKVML
jgi:hypothetical protein